MSSPALPSRRARWIWDESDRWGYHYYLEARRCFRGGRPKAASLLITADAHYQVWLNGACVGHGPAKSAEGRRSVDTYDIRPALRPGENLLEVLVLSVGVGTMTYCPGEAGLLFEIRVDRRSVCSDARVEVRQAATREKKTVRRWALPCLEDIDTDARPRRWKPARVVEKRALLYPRRVPLPTRESVFPRRHVSTHQVVLPNFSASFRLKPALVEPGQVRRWNTYDTPATLRLPLHSPQAQVLDFTPTLNQVEWSMRGRKLFTGSGWNLRPPMGEVSVRLQAGRNELVGRHLPGNHFEDFSLAGFTDVPVVVGPIQVIPDDREASKIEPMTFANAHDLAVGAKVTKDGPVRRTIWDLGYVQNGWISFQARGDAKSSLLFAFFEAMDGGPGQKVQWAEGCNNALTFRTNGQGWQRYESFFPYGVRYIAVHEVGGPVALRELCLLKATCLQAPQGDFQTDDAILNGVYRMAVQTVESGTDDTFTDCPTFEQVNWNCDNRLTSWANSWTGPDVAVMRNSILLFAEDPVRRGLVASQTPSTWSKQIPLWSFHWILWCWDYYWQTGDEPFLRKVFPRIEAGIQEALQKIGPLGLIEFHQVWHFVEWAHGRDDDHAINGAEQAGLLQVLGVAGHIAKVLGRAATYEPARARLRRAINRHLWNPKTACYADSLHADGTLSPVSSQPTNALLAIAGARNEAWSQDLARSLINGTNKMLPMGSPFGVFYILELFDQHGHGGEILRLIRQKWGEMVLAGDGTTWEMFAEFGHGGWPTRSRCHPFSTYVVKYLVKYMLGVEIAAAGCASLRINPRPPRESASATGTVPTPQGPVRISWRRKGNKLELDVEAPRGVRIVRGR